MDHSMSLKIQYRSEKMWVSREYRYTMVHSFQPQLLYPSFEEEKQAYRYLLVIGSGRSSFTTFLFEMGSLSLQLTMLSRLTADAWKHHAQNSCSRHEPLFCFCFSPNTIFNGLKPMYDSSEEKLDSSRCALSIVSALSWGRKELFLYHFWQ